LVHIPPSPKVMVPRHNSETNKPVLPNFLLRMLGPLEFILNWRLADSYYGRFTAEQPNARSVFQQRRDDAVSACAASPG
jgi:hypothetical protein